MIDFLIKFKFFTEFIKILSQLEFFAQKTNCIEKMRNVKKYNLT